MNPMSSIARRRPILNPSMVRHKGEPRYAFVILEIKKDLLLREQNTGFVQSAATMTFPD